MAETLNHITAELPEGHQLGRYRIEAPVGQGGMGTVYRAFDDQTNRNVAVKVLADGIPATLRDRFLAECEAQARIRHPNVMPVYDQAWLTDERPYFTMELLYTPITLADIVAWTADGSLSKRSPRLRHWADTAKLIQDVIVPVAEGIAIANGEYGIQHRDIKPDNILVDVRTRRPYVIDFGICRQLDEDTDEGKIIGTPRFLSTEQARGKIDARTDVWGIGALLHFVLTGEPPLAGSSPFSRAEVRDRLEALRKAESEAEAAGEDAKARGYRERREQLESPEFRTIEDLYSDARDGRYLPLPDDASRTLLAIIRKAMAPRPADRYADVQGLVDDLRAWLAGDAVQAVTETGAGGAAFDLARRAIARHLVTGVAVAIAFALAAIPAYFIFRKPPSHPNFHEVDTFEDLTDLRAQTRSLAASAEAGRLDAFNAAAEWTRIRGQLDMLEARADTLGDADRAKALTSIESIRASVAPVPVEIEGRWQVRDLLQAREPVPLAKRRALPPGLWRLERRGTPGAFIPVAVPFELHDGAPEPIRFEVPTFPEDVPDGMVWVPGSDGPGLLVMQQLVNCEQYAEYLDDLPASERRARVPPVGFHQGDPSDSTRWLARQEFQDQPVTGLSPDSIDAYVAWRSAVHGVPLRLPTEPEWRRFAGAAFVGDPVGNRLLPYTRPEPDTTSGPFTIRVRRGPDEVGEVVRASDESGLVVKLADGWNGPLPVAASYARSTPYEDGAPYGFRMVVPLGP